MFQEAFFTQKLIQLFKLQKKSATILSRHLGIASSSTCAWVTKGTIPSSKYIPGIAAYLEVPISYLFSPEMPQTLNDIPFCAPNDIYYDATPSNKADMPLDTLTEDNSDELFDEISSVYKKLPLRSRCALLEKAYVELDRVDNKGDHKETSSFI